MAIGILDDTHLINISDAIREKLGETSTYSVEEMPDKIREIDSGTSEPKLCSLSRTYTKNGSYSVTTPSGYDGISRVNVTVNVPSSEPDLGSIEITENGTYIGEDEGVDGFYEVVVDVQPPTVTFMVDPINLRGVDDVCIHYTDINGRLQIKSHSPGATPSMYTVLKNSIVYFTTWCELNVTISGTTVTQLSDWDMHPEDPDTQIQFFRIDESGRIYIES